ncbi:MAG: hypothetical protein JOZ55_05770 [Alphaproteobacteria bacterium]|nr:hypothetical protein [Alphaproteobacteria bacterium]
MGRHILLAIFCAAIAAATPTGARANWRILKDHWSRADERGFGEFVRSIGESKCSSTESCLRDEANPYRDSDESFKDVDADCAKWPYLLRAYYAWKNGLPFSYVDSVRGGRGDPRFSKIANHAASRHDILDSGGGIDAPRAIRAMMADVYSGTYRTDAADTRSPQSDFYSPAIRPGSIRPGTVIYDINGHVAIIYRVDGDGRIFYMDAHPDFTVTRSVYGAQFGQSSVELGGGLKNWRPLLLVGATRNEYGDYIGGHIAFARNDQIDDFSLVQYRGNSGGDLDDPARAHFSYDGAPLGFYEYVRVAVSGGRMSFNPVYELEASMRSLCNDLKDRSQYVDNAISQGINARTHPDSLPANIFLSSNDVWESYSTAARDARIRAQWAQTYRDLKQMIELWVNRDPRIAYDGEFLREDLERAFRHEARACTITYLNSAGHPVSLRLDAISRRLGALSFDPYHCIELRWGAEGQERESCPDGATKLRWYESERMQRNQTESGSQAAPGGRIPDVKALIDDIPEQIAFEPMAPVGQ